MATGLPSYSEARVEVGESNIATSVKETPPSNDVEG